MISSGVVSASALGPSVAGKIVANAQSRSREFIDSDAEIRSRLESIYSSGDEWADIEISVRGGVVELRGTVLRAETAEEAVKIARQLDGVVHVVDRLEAARDLGRTLRSALERFQERLYDLLTFIPLLVIAAISFAGFYLLSGIVAERVHASRRISHNRFVRDIARQVARLGVLLIGLVFVLDLLDANRP